MRTLGPKSSSPSPPPETWSDGIPTGTFSAHIGDAIPFEDKRAIEDLACYLVRAPLSLQKLVYLDGQKAVVYHLDTSPLEKPPPDFREVVRVPVDEEGREIEVHSP